MYITHSILNIEIIIIGFFLWICYKQKLNLHRTDGQGQPARASLKGSKRLWWQKFDRRLGRMWSMKKLNTNFANINTKCVFRWWWRSLWRHNSRTSLKMTSWWQTWNQQGSICWITTLSDILNHFDFLNKSTGSIMSFVVLPLSIEIILEDLKSTWIEFLKINKFYVS